MALSKLAANSFDLTDNYAFTGTTTGAVSTQKLFLIKNIDASSSGTVDFVNGASSVVLDNTYKTYLFRIINVHPSTNTGGFAVNFSIDTGSNYNVTKTTTSFVAQHAEANNVAELAYGSGYDLAQSTSDQEITQNIYATDDNSGCGNLYLFNPSSTTFIKHFISETGSMFANARAWHNFVAGYCNTTSAIDAVRFKFDTGNIDSGRIALYGIK
jgi:hypothetical protein|tara:strand:+ start:429 stop:1067 length:639 start_codon:yes stop_codon:yes gene_type:complete